MKDYLIKVDNILPREPDPAFARRARIIFANLDINGNEKILELQAFWLSGNDSPNIGICGSSCNWRS